MVALCFHQTLQTNWAVCLLGQSDDTTPVIQSHVSMFFFEPIGMSLHLSVSVNILSLHNQLSDFD